MAPPVEQEPSIEYSIRGLGADLASQVPSFGDALGLVGKKKNEVKNFNQLTFIRRTTWSPTSF